ncbi:hypothetical protein HPB50_007700 [Hyalomma asiaticum]|uniref:Uncharacterized protein n=1 Tax=Hyalomma asiaticum TaxID=266040 RepID=A0ACB7TG83_HYAAI|nr:hypothetical protein HPB50_007700 [Hyalomma asiaticum]
MAAEGEVNEDRALLQTLENLATLSPPQLGILSRSLRADVKNQVREKEGSMMEAENKHRKPDNGISRPDFSLFLSFRTTEAIFRVKRENQGGMCLTQQESGSRPVGPSITAGRRLASPLRLRVFSFRASSREEIRAARKGADVRHSTEQRRTKGRGRNPIWAPPGARLEGPDSTDPGLEAIDCPPQPENKTFQWGTAAEAAVSLDNINNSEEGNKTGMHWEKGKEQAACRSSPEGLNKAPSQVRCQVK